MKQNHMNFYCTWMPAVIRICVMRKFLCLSSLTHSHCYAMPLDINTFQVKACAFLQTFGKTEIHFCAPNVEYFLFSLTQKENLRVRESVREKNLSVEIFSIELISQSKQTFSIFISSGKDEKKIVKIFVYLKFKHFSDWFVVINRN